MAGQHPPDQWRTADEACSLGEALPELARLRAVNPTRQYTLIWAFANEYTEGESHIPRDQSRSISTRIPSAASGDSEALGSNASQRAQPGPPSTRARHSIGP